MDRARNFQAVWPSLFATSMGLMAFLPILPLYVHERFGIADPAELAFWASIVYGAAPLSAAIAGPFWGALGDRLGKKPMAIRANVAIALTTALMPFAPTPLLLVVMRAVQGVLAGYVAPAMALVSQDTPRGEQGRVIAKLQVAMASGSFLGPFVGAEATHWFGRSALFWIASLLSAGAALQLHVFAREQRQAAAGSRGSFFGDFARGCAGLLQQRVFAWLLVLVVLLRLGQNMLDPLLALFVRELGPAGWIASWSDTRELALDRTIALPFTLLAVAQWVCTPWWGRQADRHGPLRCLAVLSLGLAVLLAATAFVAHIDQFLLLRALVACLMAGSMTLAYAAAGKRVADGNRTLAFAMVQSCIQLGLAVGPMLGATVNAVAGGLRPAFLCAAVLCGVAGAGMFVLRRLSPRAPGSPHGEAEAPPVPPA